MEDSKTTDMADALTPDWTHIQSWLQNAAMELEYLAWRTTAQRLGSMPDEAPTLYKIASDLEEEPLTGEVIRRRLKEIAALSEGWRTSETKPLKGKNDCSEEEEDSCWVRDCCCGGAYCAGIDDLSVVRLAS